MDRITEMLVTILMGIIGVATLAIIISKNSNTANVIQAAASGFGNSLDVAISPVTGATVAPNLSYPGGNGIGSVLGGFTPYGGSAMMTA